MKLVNAKPVGTRTSVAHINRGEDSSTHSWEYVERPIYLQYPDGKRLRRERMSIHLSLGQSAKIVGLSASEFSDLEHGRKILSSSEEMDLLIQKLKDSKGD